jgi:rhombotail lipoprotein
VVASRLRLAFALWFLIPLAGCAPGQRQMHADLLRYLYPTGAKVKPVEQVQLQLPLRVGVAFVPSDSQSVSGDQSFGALTEFSEPEKREVLEKVAAAFRSVPEASAVDVLPGQNLTAKGGFSNLDEVASMYGVNTVALVSYTQVQYRNQSKWAILYWTLIAAYFVPADKVETQTLIDASVFDAATHALLFTGSGSDISHSTTTPFESSEKQRMASVESFDKAADKLIANLSISLGVFRENAKKGTVRGLGTPHVQVLQTRADGTQSTGGGGGGAFGPLECAGALLVGAAGLRAARSRRA